MRADLDWRADCGLGRLDRCFARFDSHCARFEGCLARLPLFTAPFTAPSAVHHRNDHRTLPHRPSSITAARNTRPGPAAAHVQAGLRTGRLDMESGRIDISDESAMDGLEGWMMETKDLSQYAQAVSRF